MSAYAIRAIVLIVVTVIMLVQASRTTAGSYRRRAFFSGAAGFGIVGVVNAVQAMGVALGLPGVVLSLLAIALISWSIYMLVRAYRSGEMKAQFEEARRAVEEERERRK
jgi:uncharacterized membrane protein